MIYGDLVDGIKSDSEPAAINPSSTNVIGFTIFNSLVDGENGLDLGTGITNFNVDVS